ncbi:MAG TPA: hypothetical protein VJR47_14565 [Stellaceae bacterium]|nr:hypothetical protein [Stellaceae bacterium]
MFWSLIVCSAAVYLGFAILIGRIFATDDRTSAGPAGASRVAWDEDEDDAAPRRATIEDELQGQSWSEALHALFLPEAL